MSNEDPNETPESYGSLSKSSPLNKDEQIVSPPPQKGKQEYKGDDNFDLLKETPEDSIINREMPQTSAKDKSEKIAKKESKKSGDSDAPTKSKMDLSNEEDLLQVDSNINDQEKLERKISMMRDDFQKLLTLKTLELTRDFQEMQGNTFKELFQSNKEDQINRKECNKKIKRIDEVLSFANVIKNSIAMNLEILHLLLSKNTVEILKKTSTLKKFVGENIDLILNSWMITNIDSDQLGSIKQSSKASPNIKNYIFQDLKKELKLLKINGQSRDLDISDIQKLNKGSLQKFSLTKMKKSIFEQIFNVKGNQSLFPKVTKLDIKHSNLEDVRLDPYFPELERLEITLSKISFEKFGTIKLQRLTDLSLTRVNMTNSGWNLLKKGLLNNANLRENLEMLSLSDNKITLFSILEEDTDDNRRRRFPNLKAIDLEENKLSKFNGENLSMIDDLQLLNLASNNFAFMDNLDSLKRCEKKVPRTLVLLQKNLFLFKTNSKEGYLKYVLSTLERFNYKVKNLAFDYLFDKANISLFKTISFSPTVQESLRELSLSYCSLPNHEVIKLIFSNSFIRLRKLDLSYNLLDDNLFKESKLEKSKPAIESSGEAEQDKYVFEKCAKLEELNLSGNPIKGDIEGLEQLTEFLKTNLIIKKVQFYNTPFDESMNGLIKEIKKRETKIYDSLGVDKSKMESTKLTKDSKEVLTIKNIISDISEKRDLSKNTQIVFNFIKGIDFACLELKLYFKNNYSSNTSKKIRFNIKTLKLKKLGDRTMYLPS